MTTRVMAARFRRTLWACAIVAACAFVGAISADAQAPLQGGSWTAGHAPMYGSSTAQPVIQDSGAASGGGPGLGLSELNVIARGTGTPPYVGQGTGPFGSIVCFYDAPTTNTNGYHYLCFSANVGSAGLIAYGAAGIAAQQALNFNINGQTIAPVTCTGAPTSSFATINGIVTHC